MAKKNEAVQTTESNEVSATQTRDFAELAKTHTTKSAMIRFLYADGMKKGEIAKALSEFYGKDMRYQHVRNVLITPVKKAD